MTRRSRIAATAATAAIAVASPAAGAKQAKTRTPAGGGKPRISTIASAPQADAAQALDAMRRAELREHRRRLAAALAEELPRGEPSAVERGLAVAAEDPAALTRSLADTTGTSEDEVAEAFEAMARHARAARLRA